MTFFNRSGDTFTVTSETAVDIHKVLPVGTYTVGFDPMAGQYFLKKIEDFSLSGKIYGDTERMSTRILDTFKDRDNSTGVMLDGEKGSGKTLQAKHVSVQAREQGIPTIVINQPHCGEGFNSFIQTIDQPTLIIFDEFEKVYDAPDQEKMLTLLDGVYPSKKLFILTCNDKYRVNTHMKNRPGRIFYRISYRGLSNEFITEYCEDNLKNKDHIPAICRLASLFSEFNFDILKALVEEMNRYDETPQDVLKVLNASPENDGASTYAYTLKVPGKVMAEIGDDEQTWRGNPLSSVSVGYYFEIPEDKREEDEDDQGYGISRFQFSDIQSLDDKTGTFQYKNSKNEVLTLKKYEPKVVDYSALAF